MMKSQNHKQINLNGLFALPNLRPVLNDLAISHYDSVSITLARPTFRSMGSTMLSVSAYIGAERNISVNGAAVTGSLEGPVDVSGNDYSLTGLSDRKRYTIIVVATNTSGFSVKQISQVTRGTGLWTWISGDSTMNQNGIYGTKGVAADANKPGSRWQLVSWIDSSDNLWLFGGMGYDAGGNNSYLSDLWEFDGSRWTWVSGDSFVNQAGVYGTRGVPAVANKPGSRWRSVSWIDSSGVFWLFGGSVNNGGTRLLNDLWRFDGSLWTWVSGDNSEDPAAVFGTKGVPADANKPGGHECAVSWIIGSDDLWLFSGGWTGNLNDLWRFDGSRWTWVSGDNTPS